MSSNVLTGGSAMATLRSPDVGMGDIRVELAARRRKLALSVAPVLNCPRKPGCFAKGGARRKKRKMASRYGSLDFASIYIAVELQ